jgi:MSHA biogenesis protein MshN
VSLINQMLRDLDDRQASTLERNGLAAQVRALPQEKRFPWASFLPIMVGVSVGAVGIWLALDTPSAPNASAATAAPPLPAAAMAMPTLVVPMPSEPNDGAIEPPAAVPAKSSAAKSLQMDFRLSQAPPHPEPAPVSAPAAQIEKRPLAPAANTAEGEYRKALAAHRQGRPNEAVEGFQGALRVDARHVSARQALLSLLLEQRRWPEAQAVAAEGLTLVAGQPGWAMILARLQIEQGQIAEAEQTMATHAPHGERSPDYQAFHGLLLERLQRPQEAREAFVRAREIGSLPPELAAAIEQRLR